MQKSINSVLSQTYKNYELIIVDGKSSDGTLKILKKNNSKIDFWISEKDKGIYDAMNKGIELSKGDIIGILNSDDIYYPNALEIVNSYFSKYKIFYWLEFVLIPNGRYIGHQPSEPVKIGITPIQAHSGIPIPAPTYKIAIPAIIRIKRSIPPTFVGIVAIILSPQLIN